MSGPSHHVISSEPLNSTHDLSRESLLPDWQRLTLIICDKQHRLFLAKPVFFSQAYVVERKYQFEQSWLIGFVYFLASYFENSIQPDNLPANNEMQIRVGSLKHTSCLNFSYLYNQCDACFQKPALQFVLHYPSTHSLDSITLLPSKCHNYQE